MARTVGTAASPSTTLATTGPDRMKVVSSSKNGFSRCSAY
jgi:hypothetical protein